MPREFQEGQHIVLERLIGTTEDKMVPPGRYVVIGVIRDLLGDTRYKIRSLPDEDLEVEVDASALSDAQEEGE